MPQMGDKRQLWASGAYRSNRLELSRQPRLHVLDADRLARRMEDHMHSDVQDQIRELEELRLPELQARFAEIVGEPTGPRTTAEWQRCARTVAIRHSPRTEDLRDPFPWCPRSSAMGPSKSRSGESMDSSRPSSSTSRRGDRVDG